MEPTPEAGPCHAGHKHQIPRKSGLLRVPSRSTTYWVGPSGTGEIRSVGHLGSAEEKTRATKNYREPGVETFGIRAQRRPGAPPAVYTAYK